MRALLHLIPILLIVAECNVNYCSWICNEQHYPNECTANECVEFYYPGDCPLYGSEVFDTMELCMNFRDGKTTKSEICLFYCGPKDWPNECKQPGEICPNYNNDGCPLYQSEMFDNITQCLNKQPNYRATNPPNMEQDTNNTAWIVVVAVIGGIIGICVLCCILHSCSSLSCNSCYCKNNVTNNQTIKYVANNPIPIDPHSNSTQGELPEYRDQAASAPLMSVVIDNSDDGIDEEIELHTSGEFRYDDPFEPTCPLDIIHEYYVGEQLLINVEKILNVEATVIDLEENQWIIVKYDYYKHANVDTEKLHIVKDEHRIKRIYHVEHDNNNNDKKNENDDENGKGCIDYEEKEVDEKINDENMECIICWENKKYYACMPCGHLCLCEKCKNELQHENETTKCPRCQQDCTFKKMYL